MGSYQESITVCNDGGWPTAAEGKDPEGLANQGRVNVSSPVDERRGVARRNRLIISWLAAFVEGTTRER